ncbi:MAG: guanylate kinase [Planctomycetales bacterium]|nr:guanylate kinase [Planctomycetales bacterium]
MASSDIGRLVIISGPSGVGKTTVVQRVLRESSLPLQLSISATTRSPRAGEQDGVHYHFLTAERFAELREQDAFLESFEVFGRGHWYGTLRDEVATGLRQGKWVILEIDVQGAARAVEQHPDAITIFIRPESLEELERRLRGRGTETEERIQSRLETARHELERAGWYTHQVVNDTVGQTVADICDILENARSSHDA